MDTLDPAAAARRGPDPKHPKRLTPAKLRLLHDYIAVAPLAVSNRNAGGLFLPDNVEHRERAQRGIVLAVGEGAWNEEGTARVPMTLQVGDLAFFGRYSGTREEFADRLVLIMAETECRSSVPAGEFEVVQHDDPKLNHLVDDYCDVCHGDPEAEAAAAARLDQQRRDLVVQTSPETLQDDSGAAAAREKRACPGVDGVACLFTQTLFSNGWGARPGNESTGDRVEEPGWVGERCGHRHPAGLA